MGDWNQSVFDYMVQDDSCVAAAMAGRADGAIYAAANAEGGNTDGAWNAVYAEAQNRKLMQEDGTEKDEWVDEAKTLLAAVQAAAGGEPPKKFFLGGKKYVTQRAETNYEETNLLWFTAGCMGGTGVNVFCTGNTIVLGFYDESSTSGKAQINYSRDAAQKMATYMRDEAGQ